MSLSDSCFDDLSTAVDDELTGDYHPGKSS